MISKFKLIPNFNISQNFVQNVQKQKNTFVLSCKIRIKIKEIRVFHKCILN